MHSSAPSSPMPIAHHKSSPQFAFSPRCALYLRVVTAPVTMRNRRKLRLGGVAITFSAQPTLPRPTGSRRSFREGSTGHDRKPDS
jgi:hypothetical protein